MNDLDKQTPLHTACIIGDLEEVTRLLNQNNNDVNRLDYNYTSPIYYAVDNDHTKIAQLIMMDPLFDINHLSDDGTTQLYLACVLDNVKVVRFLVSNGSDIYRQSGGAWNPVDWVALCLNNKSNYKVNFESLGLSDSFEWTPLKLRV